MHRGLAIAHFTSVCETKWVEFGFPIMKHTIIYHHVNLITINGPELELCIYQDIHRRPIALPPPQFHVHKKHTVNTIQNCFFRMLPCEHACCFLCLFIFVTSWCLCDYIYIGCMPQVKNPCDFHRDEQCLIKSKPWNFILYCVSQRILLFDRFMHHMESSIAWQHVRIRPAIPDNFHVCNLSQVKYRGGNTIA